MTGCCCCCGVERYHSHTLQPVSYLKEERYLLIQENCSQFSLMSTNCKSELSPNGEGDLIIKWFTEFSEMQKSDFFKILLEKYSETKIDSDILTSLLCEVHVSDQRPTIFKCRVKLFDEWFSNWSNEQKENLLVRLATADEQFVAALRYVLDSEGIDVDLLRHPIINLLGILCKSSSGLQNGNDPISNFDSVSTKKSEQKEKTTEI